MEIRVDVGVHNVGVGISNPFVNPTRVNKVVNGYHNQLISCKVTD